MRADRFALLAVAALAGGCGSVDGADKPTPPDMDALVAAYASPSGEFDPAAPDALLEGAAERVQAAVELDVHTRALETLAEAFSGEGAEPGAATARRAAAQGGNGLPLDGDGYLVVTRICDGWGGAPTADEANGFLRLNVNFTERGVDPVVWGDAQDCRYRFAESEIWIDGGADEEGDLRLHVGDALAAAELGAASILFDIDLATTIDGVQARARSDFGVDLAAASIAVRVPAPGGDVVVSVSSTGALWRVRAANGAFTCDLAEGTCAAESP